MDGDNPHTLDPEARASAPPADPPQSPQLETGGEIVSRESRCPRQQSREARRAQLAGMRRGRDWSGKAFPTQEDPFNGLTAKEKRFIRAYLQHGNLTQSAKDAGYSPGAWGYGRTGYEVSQKARVSEAIRILTEETENESRLFASRLRGLALADYSMLADCWEEYPPGSRVMRFDLKRARADGVGYLIRSYSSGPKGDRVEMVDQQRAQELLARLRGWLTDRVAVQHSLDLASLSDEQLALLASGKPPSAIDVTPSRVLPPPAQ